jgi:hypothetical protein
MLGDSLGENRAQGLYRLTFFVANILSGGLIIALVGLLGGLGGILWMLVDVIIGLVLDDGFEWGEGTVMALWMWPIDMSAWMLFGDRDFPWFPDI